MPPFLALGLWFVLLIALFRWDPAKDPSASLALWVPLIWMFIVGSRLPAQWLNGSVGQQAQALEQGNSIDRTVFFVLIFLAVIILISRSFNWGGFVSRNMALMAFVLFALVSVFWSDSTLVSFKRWFRDLGAYVVVLVILSETHPLEAVRTLFRRLCYLLVPLSIVLIKYFPNLGKRYSEWTGIAEFSGVTTGKNLLGVVCLISVIFFFWDMLTRWPHRKERRTKRIILVNLAFLVMTFWLLSLAHSATSTVCTVIGCLVLAATHSKWGKRHPGFLKVLIPVSFFMYLLLAFGLDLNGQLAGYVGRDPTLTDRTGIWKLVLSMNTNPLVGTGYESFWLGPRLQQIWKVFGPINESHNGYLEVYLNLGLIGVFLLCGFLIASYRKICKQLTSSADLASLNLAFWTIMLFYNMTEAAFKFHLMWAVFLVVAMAVPEHAADRVRTPAVDNVRPNKQFVRTPLEASTGRR
jgi:exopolysaccharide production protein ExoQ